MHAKVAEIHRPLCTSHSCTRRETEAVGCVRDVYGLYAIDLLACGKGVWVAGRVVRGRRCYTATVGVSRICWWNLQSAQIHRVI